MKQLKTILTTVALAWAIGSTGFADTLRVSGDSNYRTAPGGEFTVQSVDGGGVLPGIIAAYGQVGGYATRDLGGGVTGIQTFCLEVTEFIHLGGTYAYQPNSGAILGGVNLNSPPEPAGFDGLSVGAAWLYRQFVHGTLAGYDYNAGAGRAASASVLQQAIWMLEHEVTSAANTYLTAAVTYFAGLGASAYASGFMQGSELINAATFGVGVLNMAAAPGGFANGNARQDQIVWLGGGRMEVPDGGVTFIMLGAVPGGLALLRRKLV